MTHRDKLLDNITKIVAPALNLKEPVPGFKVTLLRAIAQVESAYGYHNLPRFEKHWEKRLREETRLERFDPWVERFGRQVSSSFGPWQLMAFNAIDHGYPEHRDLSLLAIPEISIVYVISFMNKMTLKGFYRQGESSSVLNWGSKLYHLRELEEGADDNQVVDLRTYDVKPCDVEAYLEIIGDAYNSGTSTDDLYPERYVSKLKDAFYKHS